MKIAVIGGGLGGLVTANLLADRGAKVTLFERAKELGGRARTTEQGGFAWNLGPHALYREGAAERVLRELGAKLAGAPPKTKGYVLCEGALHTLPSGPISLLTTGFLDAGGRFEAARLLARAASLRAEPGETVAAWLARSVVHPRVRALLAMTMMVATYTYPVEALPADLALAQLATAVGPGVRYLDHGWQTLVDHLAERGRAAGITFEPGARVARVTVEAGRATGVAMDDGASHRFDSIVLALGPKAAATLVPGDPVLHDAAANAVPVEAACLDVALERPTRPATILLGADEPYYASVHSAAAELAPAGAAVVHVAKYLAPGASATEGELRAILERLQPGAVVRHARFLPRLVVMNARPSTRGALVPETSSLALVGDWVGARGMLLDAVVASAEAAADSFAARAVAESA